MPIKEDMVHLERLEAVANNPGELAYDLTFWQDRSQVLWLIEQAKIGQRVRKFLEFSGFDEAAQTSPPPKLPVAP